MKGHIVGTPMIEIPRRVTMNNDFFSLQLAGKLNELDIQQQSQRFGVQFPQDSQPVWPWANCTDPGHPQKKGMVNHF